jgi:hypothetical protein
MPYCRVFRDSRGNEYFSLIHQATGRRGRVRQQLLYWFRTPPNLKIGRRAFDEETTRVLEAQYPDVQFDWQALRATPPPPVAEPWRERRRAERAARLLREDSDQDVPGQESSRVQGTPPDPSVDSAVDDQPRQADGVGASEPDSAGIAVTPVNQMRRRHRRRGRRLDVTPGSHPPSAPTESPAPSSSDEEPANRER